MGDFNSYKLYEDKYNLQIVLASNRQTAILIVYGNGMRL